MNPETSPQQQALDDRFASENSGHQQHEPGRDQHRGRAPRAGRSGARRSSALEQQHEQRKAREAEQPDRHGRRPGSRRRSSPSAAPARRRWRRGARRTAARSPGAQAHEAERRRGDAVRPSTIATGDSASHLPNRPAKPNSARRRAARRARASARHSATWRTASVRRACQSAHVCHQPRIAQRAGCARMRRVRVPQRAPARLDETRPNADPVQEERDAEPVAGRQGHRRRPQRAGQPRQGRRLRHRRRPARQVPAQGQVLSRGRRRLRLLRRRVRLGHEGRLLRQHDAHRLAQGLSRRARAASTSAPTAPCPGTTTCRSSSASSSRRSDGTRSAPADLPAPGAEARADARREARLHADVRDGVRVVQLRRDAAVAGPTRRASAPSRSRRACSATRCCAPTRTASSSPR